MPISQKVVDGNLREEWVKKVSALLENEGEEVLLVKSNEIALPVLDELGDEKYVVLTIKVPSGTRDGDAYNGHELAQDYTHKLEQKAIKAEKRAAEKEKKIARDKKLREQKAKAKAEQEKNGTP